MMAKREKKPVHKVKMTEGKRQIIQQLLQKYDIETAEDIQEALKDLPGGTIKEMMEAEMDDHLGYEKSERSDSDDYRNGYKEKTVNSSYGSMRIDVPQDRKSTFEPKVVKKRQKDISEIHETDGLEDCHLCLNIVNDQNPDKTLYSIVDDGIVIYDCTKESSWIVVRYIQKLLFTFYNKDSLSCRRNKSRE